VRHGIDGCVQQFRPKFFNEPVEKELTAYKKEVEEKFVLSLMNNTYVFPRKSENYLLKQGTHVSRSNEREYAFGTNSFMQKI